MGKNFKIVSSVVAILVLLFVLTLVMLTKLIDPNDYRNQIEQFVYSKTGRQIDIQGRIQWSFFPRLGINLPEVTIGNPKGITGPNFAHIENLNLEARLFPLLTGKIEIDEVNIENAKINFIIEKNNANNWRQWHVANQPQLTFYASLAPTPLIKPKEKSAELPVRSVSITSLSVKNSRIQLIDRRNDQIYQFRNFDLNITDFNTNRDFPLQVAFDFKPSSNNLMWQHRLIATAHVDLKKKQLLLPEFSPTTFWVRPDLGKLPIDVEGKLTLDLAKKTLSIPELSVQLANMLLKGELRVTDLTHNPKLQTTLQAQGTALKPFLMALAGVNTFSGKMNVETTLSAGVSDLSEALSTLTGSGKIQITDGSFQGLNLPHLFSQAAVYTDGPAKIIVPDTAPNETTFSKISASYTISNGILSNNDLSVESDKLTTRGAGTVNLDTHALQYKLEVQNTNKKPNDIVLPIVISGTLDRPQIMPDFKKIADKYFKRSISDFINDKGKNAGSLLKGFLH